MALCRDSRTEYLRKYGYNVIALPRAGIQPLTVAYLDDDRQLRELGYLPEIWTSDSDVPSVGAAENIEGVTANIEGKVTDKIDAEIGLGILADLVGALGFNGAEIKTKYQSAKTVSFHFSSVDRSTITAFALGEYLMKGSLSSGNPFVRRYLTPDEKVFVVTEILSSNSFGVSADKKSGGSLELDIPVLTEIVGGKAGLKAEKSDAGVVQYSGQRRLPFAFVAAQLSWENDRWSVVAFPSPGSVHLGKDDAKLAESVIREQGGAVLFSQDGLVEFSEPEPD